MADPTASEFFGQAAAPGEPPPLARAPGGPAPPTAADFFAPPKPLSGPAQDTIWSSAQGTLGRLLNTFNFGAANDWGAKPLGLDPEADKVLRGLGVLPDYEKGRNDFFKSANEAVIRPAAALVDAAARAEQMSPLGLPIRALNALPEMLGQARKEVQGSAPDRSVLGVLAAPLGIAGELGTAAQSGYLGPEFLPGTGAAERIVAGADVGRLRTAAAARATGVIGEGEAGFYDAAPPTPEGVQARTAAAQEAGVEPPQPVAPPPDVHALARRIDPETFEQYDAASVELNRLRVELWRLSAEREPLPEAVEAQAQIDAILGRVNNVPSRLTKAAAERLAAAQERLDGILHTDTPEMTAARTALMDADFAMRDLAPDVSAAYRAAREIAPELPETAPVKAETPVETPAMAEAGETPEAPAEPPQTGVDIARETAQAAETVTPGTAPEVVAERAAAAAGASEEAQAAVAPPSVTGKEKLGAGGASRPSLAQARYGDLKAVKGTGETVTRGLSAGVEESAIEQGLSNSFGDLPEYERVSMADQARQAAELMESDYDAAKAVAMGERQPPKGLLPESVFVAVEKRALAEGDVETLRQLATRSRLNAAATTMGQRIRTLGERDPTSPVGAIQIVQQAREAALSKVRDVEAAKAETVAAIKTEMKAAASKPEAWKSFLDSIKCAE